MKKNLVICFLVAMSFSVWQTAKADRIGIEDAQRTAQHFVQSRSAGKLMSPSHNVKMTLAHAEPSKTKMAAIDYYVFNASDGNSFVIVAGDDRAVSVLGFGQGSLDMTDIPCNMQWLLDFYQEQMDYLYEHPGLEVTKPAPSLNASAIEYVPMLTSDWSQGSPYNNLCPEHDGELCVTGCVATAMAQVMYYWRHPQSCPSVVGYRLPWMTLPELAATTFEWNSMLDVYTGQYTASQARAVAKLMRYCGQAVKMDYGVDGSGATVANQLHAMKFMGYNSNATMVNRSSYNASTWTSMMLSDLANGYPILYSGSGTAGGHAFVVDGYDGSIEMFHINWGWASRGNGYFALGAFDVLDYSFNSQQQMLRLIFPNNPKAPETAYDFMVDGIYYKYDNNNSNQAIVTCKDSQFNSYRGEIVIPQQVTYNGREMTVTAVGKNAFRDCKYLTSVSMPATVKVIDDYAFRSATALQDVVFPEQLEVINNQAFTNCISLKTVYLSRPVREIGYRAFENCKGLTRLDIDDLQSWIDLRLDGYYSTPLLYAHHLFIDGVEVKHLVLPDNMTSVADYKFAGFSGMTSLTLPQGLVSIGVSAFEGCSSLTSLEFPASLTTLSNSAFKNCLGLLELTLDSTLQRVGGEAFSGCSGLETVDFRGPVEHIGTDAFLGCTGLQRAKAANMETWLSIGFGNEYANPLALAHRLVADGQEVTSLSIPRSVDKIGNYAFYGFDELTEVVIGNHVTAIGTSAFARCKGLKQVAIGDGVTLIGEKAFSTCGALESLTIGSSVNDIKDRAFIACLSLKEVICRAVVPPVPDNVIWFSNATCSNAVLKVPKASVLSYRKTGEWSRFTHIEGVDMSTGLAGDINEDGEVNIADVNALIDIIMTGKANRGANIDVNGDGEVNIADVNALIEMILH